MRKRGDVGGAVREPAAAQPVEAAEPSPGKSFGGVTYDKNGIGYLACPKCGLTQSIGSTVKRPDGLHCIRCVAALGIGPRDEVTPSGPAEPPQDVPQAPAATRGGSPPPSASTGQPGAADKVEPANPTPPCEVCGAALTKTAVGAFYSCGHDKRASAADPRPGEAPAARTPRGGGSARAAAVRGPVDVAALPVTPGETRPAVWYDEGEEVSATWGPELYSPIRFNTCTLGPFGGSTRVRPGETRATAMKRLYAELEAFAKGERDGKLVEFGRAVARMGGGQ